MNVVKYHFANISQLHARKMFKKAILFANGERMEDSGAAPHLLSSNNNSHAK